MFTSSKLRAALDEVKHKRFDLALGGGLPDFILEQKDDRRGLKIAVVVTLLLHAVLFVVRLPEIRGEPRQIQQAEQTAYVVQQVRFQPPPPEAQRQVPKKREKKRVIPIPDPTPEEPEPIRIAGVELPEVDDIVDDAVFGIPEGIPGPGPVVPDAVPLTGAMTPPQKIHAPRPLYTEEARQARIQGVVILSAVVDREGNVTGIEVLKGLPEGLSESAVEAVKSWRFKPATLGGEPVAVYYNFTISFGLQ